MEAKQVDENQAAQVLSKDEIIEQNHFGHIYRKKTNLELIRLSFIITGVEFIYAVENAFLAPILLEAGLDHTAMTWAFGISPTLGILFSPLIASISDRCNAAFGRRRPFILALSCGILIGLTLVPHGIFLGQLLGDDPQITTGFKWAVLFTIVGTFILDFDTENTQTMSRAYFLDVCVSDDHTKIMSISTVMGGIGGFTGYIMGGIDWVQTSFGQFLGGNVSTIFILNTLVFIVCLILTITSYKEVPRPFLKKHGLLKPHAHDEEMNTKLDDDDEEKPVKPLFFVSYFKNIIYMPNSMKILILTNLFSWAAYLSFCMYFTTFVGEVIYKGDPYAPKGSDELLRYEEGVRFGCLGMATLTFTCAIYSAAIEKLIKLFKGRIVYPGAMLTFAIGMGALSIFQVKWVAVLGCVTAGVCHSTLFVMPFLLIAQYHSKGSFQIKGGNEIASKQDRGLGGDIAITNSMLFVAQLSLSIFLGPLITLVNTTAVVIYTACIFSFLAAISATQIVYMDI